MAIITDSIVDVGNYITFNIGLSKAISNYTADEIWNFPYCSSSWDAFRHVFDESYQGIAPGTLEASEYQMPFHFTGVNQAYVPATYNFEEGQINYNQGDLGIYGKIIWLCELGNTSISNIFGTKRCIKNTDSVKIITQMDMTQVCLFLDTFQNPASNDPMYANYDNFKIKENHEGVTTYEHPRNCSIFPAVMFQYNGKLYIHRIFQDSYTNLDWSWWLSYRGDSDHGGHTEQQGHHFDAQPVSFDGTKEAYFAINIMRQFSGLRPTTTERFYTASDIEDVGVRYQWMYGYDGGRICPASENKYLQMISWYGGMFYHNGKYYKPIIEDGYVSGYTDDMTVPSDIDNWIGATNHNVPATPPGGGDDDDPWKGVEFGGTGAGGGGAFCSVYYMTGAQLTSLKNWSNTSSPEGFDMLPSIIGLQQLPVAVSGAPTTVKFLKSGAITQHGESRVIDTGVAAGTGTGQPISFSLGSININRRMQQRGEPYLDYDSTIELFLPFAGTFVLDTQAVMGRTIQAEIVIDPVNGTAFAYAWVSQGGQKMPIAYGGGSIAVDLPIASNQWGISRAAFKQVSHQATMNAVKDIGSFMIGLRTFKTGQSGAIADRSGFASLSIHEGMQAKQIGSQMMASSTISAATDTASSIVNAHQLNNTNYTAVNGSFGGSYAEWSQPFTAYVRITRPKVKKPSNFNHTQGVPCVETKQLSSCSGLTICINPDCGAIPCTEAEKLMITQALVGGVYAGGGE